MKTIAWMAVGLGAMAGKAAAETCGPAAEVAGDERLAEEVRAGLARRGVTGAAEGCPVVRVKVERRDDRVVVAAEDDDGTRSQRVLEDAGTAVIIVEAWALSGVVDDDAEDLTMVPERASPAVERPRRQSGMEMGMGGGVGMDTREDQTHNAVVDVCWLGDYGCAGFRAAMSDGTTFHSASMLATAEAVWSHGRFALTMTLGLGFGVTRVDGAMDAPENIYAVRALTGLGGRVTVAPQVALEVGVSSEASLDRQAWETAKYIASPEDDTLVPPMINATLSAGVGLRYKFR